MLGGDSKWRSRDVIPNQSIAVPVRTRVLIRCTLVGVEVHLHVVHLCQFVGLLLGQLVRRPLFEIIGLVQDFIEGAVSPGSGLLAVEA